MCIFQVALVIMIISFLFLCTKQTEFPRKNQDLSLLDLDNNSKQKTCICENCAKEEPVLKFHNFSFSSISDVTEKFSPANKIGDGRFGPVYKGTLLNGQSVAVKRVANLPGQGVKQLEDEAIRFAKCRHKNLLKILGYCNENDENILIYEYMPNQSLDSFLFDPIKKKKLNWSIRAKIIDGILQGLYYLWPYNTRSRVLYRNLNARNILLDGDMNPKISDVQMTWIFGIQRVHANTNCVLGTYGYRTSEYGQFYVRSDEFAFGILLLEILSGKQNTNFRDSEYVSLLGYAWYLWENDKALDLIDPILEIPSSIALRYINVALLCTQELIYIPIIHTVISMLSDEQESLPSPMKPYYITEDRTELKLEMD